MSEYHQRSRILLAMAHSARLQILKSLAHGPACVCDLILRTGERQAYISQHLMLLHQTGRVCRLNGIQLLFWTAVLAAGYASHPAGAVCSPSTTKPTDQCSSRRTCACWAAPLLQTPHTFAIVGASQDQTKYGDEVLETLTRHEHRVLPINPKYTTIDGHACYPSLPDLLHTPDVVVTAAPASVSEKTAETCAALGIPIFWLPPGTEMDAALEICQQNNITAIHRFCPVLVLTLPRERWIELP